MNPMLITHKKAIVAHEKRIRRALKYKTPSAVRTGRRNKITNSGKTFFGLPPRVKPNFEGSDRSRLYPMIKIIKVETVIAIVSGMVDKGCERPRIIYNSLINNPTNIEKAILKPAESKMISR